MCRPDAVLPTASGRRVGEAAESEPGAIVLRRSPGPILVLLLLLGACGRRVPPPRNGPGGPAAAVAVERFFELVRERDYVQMGWVFGTSGGAVIRQWPLAEVEQRMYALASVLQHEGLTLGPESAVPGRTGEAVRFATRIQHQGRSYDVPVVAVRGPDGRWYVEQVELQAVTNVR